MNAIIKLFRGRDARIQAQIDAMCDDLLPAIEYEPKPFLETEREVLASRICQLQLEINDRAEAVEEYEHSIAVLTLEMADRRLYVRELERVLTNIAEDGVLVAAE